MSRTKKEILKLHFVFPEIFKIQLISLLLLIMTHVIHRYELYHHY